MFAAIGCFLAYWLIWSHKENISLTGAWVKTMALAPIAALWFFAGFSVFTEGGLFAYLCSYMGLMALGLAFGAGGDFALARRSETAFLTGMAAFAIGHMLYAFAIWRSSYDMLRADIADETGYAFIGWEVQPVQIAALVALATLLISTEFWLIPKTGTLRWPVRGYVLTIGAMAASAAIQLDCLERDVLRIGAALFVLSDVLLALRLFVVTSTRSRTALSLLVWPCYWIGQMLIASGAMLHSMGPWDFGLSNIP